MYKNKQFLKTALVSSLLFASSAVLAGGDRHDDDDRNIAGYLDTCDTLPLVNTLVGGPVNTTVCVDAPVALTKVKTVFNIDTPFTDSAGRPVALRHMWMLGTAIKARIQAGLVDPEKVSIIGLMHGGGSAWAHKSIAAAEAGSTGAMVKDFIEKIYALKKDGVNISLEMCGVTMLGKNWTNDDLYKSDNGMIHVNQGAIGRLIDLEQHGYAYVQED